MKVLHRLTESCWYGGSPWSTLLLPLSWLYGGAVALRRMAYNAGVLKVRESAVPVIVIGNITVGGTGKTPVVIWLAEQLTERGHRPAIVSRGYGGQPSAKPVLVTPDSDASAVGDEPTLLASTLGCPVVVCTDRAAAVACAAAQGADVIISDDGLQHYRMQRSLEWLVVDGARGFGNARLLPAGPLRESRQRIRSVDAVLINGGHPGIAGTVFSLEPQPARRLGHDSVQPLSAFAGQEVWSVAGIGNPGRFHSLLRAAGLQVREVQVGDHQKADLQALLQQARLPILMTEKDAVKYTPPASAQVWYVPVKLQMPEANADQLMHAVLSALQSSHV